ncbi:hypothetical protein [Azomonas macrocytogenes]|uniref:Uncharacterized protein n=1 Tax=Azomonas macrocytogenes TaxID=69962 RepID=A0A839T7V9_AZOMA|nr:hypothetical protein [Azomonas macrocytogenes]MBB3103753.1 hypothetical protein [Azomonas macrocytogenes]
MSADLEHRLNQIDRENDLESLQERIASDISEGDPKTCNAFADFCANELNGSLIYAFCLARIQADDGLLKQTLDELDTCIETYREKFIDAETGLALAAYKEDAEARWEAIHFE